MTLTGKVSAARFLDMFEQRRPFQDANVQSVFAAYPSATRDALLDLREVIFQMAATTTGVGRVEETLKWGQPAYLTSEPKSGSTIRLGRPKSGGFAIYAHCQTTIISDFRSLFPHDFIYDGNRGVQFEIGQAVPVEKVRLLIASALTYHLK